ncbi:hypothetical protein KY289_013513 [Solanum tuberosum]|nr:hypothetical protein KY289_013513 [Solanum tuberosum]
MHKKFKLKKGKRTWDRSVRSVLIILNIYFGSWPKKKEAEGGAVLGAAGRWCCWQLLGVVVAGAAGGWFVAAVVRLAMHCCSCCFAGNCCLVARRSLVTAAPRWTAVLAVALCLELLRCCWERGEKRGKGKRKTRGGARGGCHRTAWWPASPAKKWRQKAYGGEALESGRKKKRFKNILLGFEGILIKIK